MKKQNRARFIFECVVSITCRRAGVRSPNVREGKNANTHDKNVAARRLVRQRSLPERRPNLRAGVCHGGDSGGNFESGKNLRWLAQLRLSKQHSPISTWSDAEKFVM